MSKHNGRGFLFDIYGRVKEWKCPHCGDRFGANLQGWPKSATGLWRARHRHLKEHEEEEQKKR